MPPNQLIILADQMRADALGMVQHGVAVTPRLDALPGRRFETYTSCPLCVPARTSLWTGRTPAQTGITWNKRKGACSSPTLFEALAAAGYTVAIVGDDELPLAPTLDARLPGLVRIRPSGHKVVLAAAGWTRPSAEAMAPFRRQIEEGGHPVWYSSAHAGPWPGPAELHYDRWLATQAARLVADLPEPFVLLVNIHAPHPPLMPPADLANRFDPGRLILPPSLGRPATGEWPGRRQGSAARLADGVDEAGWRRAWAAHLALVTMVDGCVGTIEDAVAAAGRQERTVRLFLGDHGEALGCHGLYQKMDLLQDAIRVPCQWWGLGIAPGAGAGRLHHLDIAPTLAGFAGLPADPDWSGLDARAALAGGVLPARELRCWYAGNHGPAPQAIATLYGRMKRIQHGDGTNECFDLTGDPWELQADKDMP